MLCAQTFLCSGDGPLIFRRAELLEYSIHRKPLFERYLAWFQTQIDAALLGDPSEILSRQDGLKGATNRGFPGGEAKDDEIEMKALRYFFCIVLPPLAVLLTGRIASFFLSLILTMLGWIPGIIHACLVVNDYHAEQRAAR